MIVFPGTRANLLVLQIFGCFSASVLRIFSMDGRSIELELACFSNRMTLYTHLVHALMTPCQTLQGVGANAMMEGSSLPCCQDFLKQN